VQAISRRLWRHGSIALAPLLAACSSGRARTPPPFPSVDTAAAWPISGRGIPALVAGTFTTDSTAYTARPARQAGDTTEYAFTVVTRLENRGDVPIYLGRCYPNSPEPIYGVQRLDTTAAPQRMRDRAAYDPIWACVGHDYPFEVPPGTARVDTLRLTGPNAWDGVTHEGLGHLEGRFRLAYRVGACPPRSGRCARPDALWYTNAFTVRLQP
jgi:hypothetical protein